MNLVAFFLFSGLGDITAVRVHGATVFSEGQIVEVTNIREGKPFRIAMVRGGEVRIRTLYESRGYFRVSVKDSIVQTDKGIEIHLLIDEGPRAKLVDIVPEGARQIDSLSLLRILMKSVPADLPVYYDDEIIANVEKSLYSLYQNTGFPFVEITSTIEEISPNLISARVTIDEGPRVRIRDIVIRGNQRVREEIIAREIDIKPGDHYNFEKITEAQRRIYSTGLFSSVQYNLDTVGPQDTLAILYFTVTETSPRYLDVGGGFHTPLELQAKLSIGHLNLWGKGQRAEIGGESSWNFQGFPRRKLNFSYSEPYFLGFRLDATARVAYSYDVDLDYEELSATFLTRKYLGKYWSVSPGARWSYSREITADTVISSIPSKITVNALTQELLLDSRDNIFDPFRGLYGRLYLEEAGWTLGGYEDHLKEFFSLSSYFKLSKGGYTLASRLSLGYILPYGRTAEIHPSERFTLGGDGTVRGYTRYSIGQFDPRRGEGELVVRSGSKLYNLNLELRKHISTTWGFAIFTDLGGLWKNYRPVELSESAWSAGFGIRYYLPIGPIRLDWARPVLNYSGWGIIHIGLGHMF